MSVGERALNLGVSGALGAASEFAGPYVAKGATSAYRAVRHPVTSAQRLMLRGISKETIPETASQVLSGGGRRAIDIAKEGAELSRETGVGMGADQLSGSRALKKIGGTLRQAPHTADDMSRIDLERTNQLHTGVMDVIDGVVVLAGGDGGRAGAAEGAWVSQGAKLTTVPP